ncbi:MAG: hypothetical protein QW083_04490 [Methanomassiliicoccales archaeon]
MAKKRVIRVKVEEKSDEASQTHEEKEVPWGVWLRKTYTKYWYVVSCMFLDSFLALEIARSYGDVLGASPIAIILVAVVAVEVLLYTKLWPREDRRE